MAARAPIPVQTVTAAARTAAARSRVFFVNFIRGVPPFFREGCAFQIFFCYRSQYQFFFYKYYYKSDFSAGKEKILLRFPMPPLWPFGFLGLYAFELAFFTMAVVKEKQKFAYRPGRNEDSGRSSLPGAACRKNRDSSRPATKKCLKNWSLRGSAIIPSRHLSYIVARDTF